MEVSDDDGTEDMPPLSTSKIRQGKQGEEASVWEKMREHVSALCMLDKPSPSSLSSICNNLSHQRVGTGGKASRTAFCSAALSSVRKAATQEGVTCRRESVPRRRREKGESEDDQ
jgi:hypothetical protein